MCVLSSSHYKFSLNTSTEPVVGGFEQPSKYIWLYLLLPGVSQLVILFFLFFFVLFFCRPCFFSFPFSFFFLTLPPFPLSGEARRDWTRYGKQTALSGRYHSNCLTVWFAVGFLTVRFSHFYFSLLIWFLLFQLLFFLFLYRFFFLCVPDNL